MLKTHCNIFRDLPKPAQNFWYVGRTIMSWICIWGGASIMNLIEFAMSAATKGWLSLSKTVCSLPKATSWNSVFTKPGHNWATRILFGGSIDLSYKKFLHELLVNYDKAEIFYALYWLYFHLYLNYLLLVSNLREVLLPQILLPNKILKYQEVLDAHSCYWP